MKKLALAFAVLLGTYAPNAGAMNLGSLARQNPLAGATELATVADPAVCRDLTCGLPTHGASNIAPMLHVIFSSVSVAVIRILPV